MWRDAADLPEDLVFRVDYLGGDLPTFALNFSRPAGQVIAQYYLLLRHGHAGYRDIDQACACHARYIAERLPRAGPFQLLYDGQGALPAVCYTLADGSAPFTWMTSPTGSGPGAGRSPLIRCPPAGKHDRAADPDPARIQPGHGPPSRRRHRAQRRRPDQRPPHAAARLPSHLAAPGGQGLLDLGLELIRETGRDSDAVGHPCTPRTLRTIRSTSRRWKS